jgi:phosphatidylinositol N-acetylglucosaminyltransferase subunit A
MGISTVYTDHSLFGFSDVASVILNRVLQVSLATVDAAICVSYTCRDNFVLRTQLTKEKQLTGKRKMFVSSEPPFFHPRIHVIPNAVDSSQFTPHAHEAGVTGR